MKEKMEKLWESSVQFLEKMKEQLKKVDILKKFVGFAKENRLIFSMVLFSLFLLCCILIATIGWGEYVVPVCILMILETTMAMLLHRSELWIHGILMGLHIIVAVIIARVPLTILCMAAYVAATLAQRFAFNEK